MELRDSAFNRIYWEMLQELSLGPYDQASRNGFTSELHPVCFRLTDVHYRSLSLPGRRKNLLLQLVEFLWIWSGSNNLAPLAAACPRWADYSDDGITLHGAYGKRLRRSQERMDQLTTCLAMLQRDPNTRQAVITIWDPGLDLQQTTKDKPCNNWLHFLIRDNKLDLTVVLRSNDLWWGTPYNVFNWTQLQCVCAARLGILPGTYTHFADSLHVYQTHQSAYDRVLSHLPPAGISLPVTGVSDAQLSLLWRHVSNAIERGEVSASELFDERDYCLMPEFWRDYGVAVSVGFFLRHNASRSAYVWSLVERMTTPLRLEVALDFGYWLTKHHLTHPEGYNAWLQRLPSDVFSYVAEGLETRQTSVSA